MKTGALVALVIGLMVPVTLEAQRDRDWNRGQVPAGMCRVWYDGLPANRQPAPMNCRQAENIARRDRSARVIYGSDSSRGGWGDIFRRYPNQNRYPYPDRGGYGSGPAYSVGYKDGYDKGLDDADDNDRYDPSRHGRYKSADHEYEREYGSKEQYRITYREGFLAGYDDGYRNLRSPRGRF